MLDQQLINLYKQAKKSTFSKYNHKERPTTSHNALQWARYEIAAKETQTQFDDLESQGLVRIRHEPDYVDFENMCGDMFDPDVNTDIKPEILEREKEEYCDKLNRDGVWFVISEYFDGKEWQHADSIGAIEGTDSDICGYTCDLQQAAIDALISHNYTRHIAPHTVTTYPGGAKYYTASVWH